MARSLRGGVLDQLRAVVARTVAAELTRRNIVSQAQGTALNVAAAFSSWDNCMKASFCKWPVIAVIIVGGLIIIGVIWCIIRCACCGLACCCSCFKCLKCCGNCCGCCDAPGERRHKYLDEPYIPPHHGYQQQAPMQAPASLALSAAKQPAFEPPQYAEFDVSKKANDDALPQMPSWEGAGSKKVKLDDDEVELSQLKKTPSPHLSQPRLAPPSTGPTSPMGHEQHGPYGDAGHGQRSPYADAGHGQRSPYADPRAGPYGDPRAGRHAQGQGHHQPGHGADVYAKHESGFGLDEPYDDPMNMGLAHQRARPAQDYANPFPNQPFAPPLAVATGQGRQSPAPGRPRYANQGYSEMPEPEPTRRGGYDQQYSSPAPNGYGMPRQGTGGSAPDAHAMRRQGTGGNAPDAHAMRRHATGESLSNMASRQPYGADPYSTRNSPGPRRTPAPQGDGPYAQHPPRSPQFARDPGHGARYAFDQSPPRSPIRNNAGFDFTSGYARPGTADGRRAEPVPSPTREAAYPGYKPYSPAP